MRRAGTAMGGRSRERPYDELRGRTGRGDGRVRTDVLEGAGKGRGMHSGQESKV